jgi:membrane-bound lytic murein transglycosylase B
MKFLIQRIVTITLLLGLVLITQPVLAKPGVSWRDWVAQLRLEAVAEGIKPQLFDYIFSEMQPSEKHIRYDRSQPETRLTYYQYRDTRGNQYRITSGRKEYSKHKQLIDTIGFQYGVDPCLIVTIWGMESNFGRVVGDFDVIRSLATLAYDSRRSEFFHKELLLALHMVNEGHIALEDFKGEWAGANGQAQFLPSSWYKYAVDYNLDGNRDIWRTYSDIFASIANYLRENGWQYKQPVLIEVTLPAHFSNYLLDLDNIKTIREWLYLGVQIKSGQAIPDENLPASIIQLYGGPPMMIFNNFRVLLSWNYSLFYAATVNYVTNEICSS